MKKLIAAFLVLTVAVFGLAACSLDNTDAFSTDSAELYTARTEVLNYLVEEGEITEEAAEQELNIYCQQIGDCTFGTGVCDGTGAGKCVALGLTEEQIAKYIEQRREQLNACVEDGIITQEEADLLLQSYAQKLEGRAEQLGDFLQNGNGVCESKGSCSGMGSGNRYRKGNGGK